MRNYIVFSTFLIFIACEQVHLDTQCVLEHTTTVVKLESSLLGTNELVSVNLAWTWVLAKPSGDGIIIERSLDDSLSFIAVDTLLEIDSIMYYSDNDSILRANSLAYYRLGFLSSGNVDYFKTIEVTIPASQHFYQPASDTLADTLAISFAELTGFHNCSVALYQTLTIEPESLLNLTNALFDTTLAYPDTTLVVYLPDSIFHDTLVYTIKITSSGSLQLITDTSLGFRAFFKKPS